MEVIALMTVTIVVGFGMWRSAKKRISGWFGMAVLLAAYLVVFAWAAYLLAVFTR